MEELVRSGAMLEATAEVEATMEGMTAVPEVTSEVPVAMKVAMKVAVADSVCAVYGCVGCECVDCTMSNTSNLLRNRSCHSNCNH